MAVFQLGLVWPAFAQEQPAPESSDTHGSTTLQEVDETASRYFEEVDETALRYFARLGDQQRLRAEIARLQTLYPGWVPPVNPLSTEDPENSAIQALWDLYGTGDIDGVEAAITERRGADPEWQPPADLLAALERARATRTLQFASDARDFETVIATAATYPDLLTCANIDLLWRLGEAFIDSGRTQRGQDVFTFVLETCENEQERYATMQKATALMNREEIAALLVHERGDEFAGIKVEMARRAVADFLNGIASRIAPNDVDILETAVREGGELDDLMLLGYYELEVGRPRQALGWFDSALKRDSTPDTAMANGAALMALDRHAEAEAILAGFRLESAEAENLYLSVVLNLLAADPPRVLEPDVLSRISDAVVAASDATGAMNMGWYAYKFDQITTAASWFRKALEFDPSAEAAAYGLVVASNRLRDRNTIKEMQGLFKDISPRIAQFGRPGAPTAAPMRYAPAPSGFSAMIHNAVLHGDARGALVGGLVLVAELTPAHQAAGQTCPTYVPPSTLSANAALSRGWCLLNLERAAEAVGAFNRAIQTTATSTRADAAYGLTLSYIRLSLVSEAAVAAALVPQTEARVAEMQIGILTATAVAFYDVGRYREVLEALDRRSRLAPEQSDLLTLRAWSYYHLGFRRQAEKLFRALAAAGHRDAAAGLAALGLDQL